MTNVQHLVALTTDLLKEKKSINSSRTLFEEGWRIILTRAKRQAGVCHHHTKHIGLSAILMSIFKDDSAWNTATHEVAHAIAGIGHGHDYVWKTIHRSLGGNAERLYSDDVFNDNTVPPKQEAPYIGTCPNGHTSNRFKLPRRQVSCGICCRHFDVRFLISWERRK